MVFKTVNFSLAWWKEMLGQFYLEINRIKEMWIKYTGCFERNSSWQALSFETKGKLRYQANTGRTATSGNGAQME
ncbi:hypothetical protein Y1Q_0019824 [Alligator mississippiensis]|uniref:Uncharacterized protein n=1 Tax=Alligator mississippiensis TaxID=8496 RepID=A0A151PFH9_ALLMI|nr:hypothetical protein Y1Q_0019824 [Alligator mississippiensis]